MEKSAPRVPNEKYPPPPLFFLKSNIGHGVAVLSAGITELQFWGMALEVVICGSDIPVDFQLKQNDGTNLNLTGVAQIFVAFYFQERSGQLVAKFSKTSVSGYTLLEVTNAAEGRFRCMITADKTESLDGGILLCDVKVKITDGTLSDGDFETILPPQKIADLKPSPLSRA